MAEYSADLAQERIEWAKTGKGANNDAAPKTLDDVRHRELWVGWKTQERNGKPTKVPFDPKSGRWAKSDNPATWATRDKAENWARTNSGQIGIMFAPISQALHLGGIDLDTCRDPQTGEMQPWALDIINRLGSYTEVSPSGTGVKVFFLYCLSDMAELNALFGGEKKHSRMFKRGGGDHPPAIEVHRSNRYFAVTWQTFENFAALRIVSIENFQWLIEKVGPAFSGKPKGATASSDTHDDSRSGKAFREGARVKASGATYEKMREALRNSDDPEVAEWVREKGMPNDERELRRIYENTPETPGAPEELIQKLNETYAIALEAGKATILREHYDPVLKRNAYERVTPADFKVIFQNQLIQVGEKANGEPIFKKLGDAWLESPRRRQYLGGVVFSPAEDPGEGFLNLWTGFAVNPRKGSWKKLRKHIWNVICKKDRASFRYLLQWLASVVQHPEQQGYTIIVLRGKQGAGKGILGQAMIRILGGHSLHIRDARHLTGHFNAHLQACVFLFADEALYAGEKAHQGVLKGLATESTLPIEGKFRNVLEARNFLHLFMASNEKWVVPADLDARRFVVFDVDDAHANDHPYFAPIRKEMEKEGGDAAMLYDLLRIDLSKFNVADIPQTEGLKTQKKLSLKGEYQWWQDVLTRGYILKSRLGLDYELERWRESVTTDLLYESYSRFIDEQRGRYPSKISRESLGRFLREMVLKPTKAKTALAGECFEKGENGGGRE